MGKSSIRLLFVAVLSTCLLLAGCTEKKISPAENMYTKLESVVVAEEDFADQIDPLAELEQQEHELFEQIVSLSMNEFDQIVELSEQALKVVEERNQFIEKERKSMLASEEKFKEVNEVIATFEDEELKKEAEELYSTMTKRYESHKTLYDSYKMGIQLDQELYEMLKNEQLTLEELESKINAINEAYQTVIAANDSFNELTERYNESKKEFYERAELEVTIASSHS